MLGPFLFLVYINDLPRSCNSIVLLYDDDAVLLCCDKNVANLKIKCETEFIKIEDWIMCNKLILNYSKTNCLLISNENKKTSSENFHIIARNGIITEQNVVKYLGVYNDKQLTWKIHIEHVIQTLSIARDIFSKLRHYALNYYFKKHILLLSVLAFALGSAVHLGKCCTQIHK